jgi:cytochrome c5
MRTVPATIVAVALAAAAAAPAQADPRSGREVYEQVCAACHASGELGAPKLGDAKAWKPLIAEGQAALSRTAIKGIRKMPAKGGRPDLSDLEVRRAVAYLGSAAGAKWTEPAR